jgi:hypothetical protein
MQVSRRDPDVRPDLVPRYAETTVGAKGFVPLSLCAPAFLGFLRAQAGPVPRELGPVPVFGNKLD